MTRLGLLAAVAAAAIATSSRAADFTFSFIGDGDHPGTVTGTIYGLADSGSSTPTDIKVTAAGDNFDFAKGGDGVGFDGEFTVTGSTLTYTDFRASHGYPDTFEGQSLEFDATLDNTFVDSVAGVFVQNNDGRTGVTFSLVPGTSAAPEPSTWALMLAGVSLAGFALRSRERVSAVTA